MDQRGPLRAFVIGLKEGGRGGTGFHGQSVPRKFVTSLSRNGQEGAGLGGRGKLQDFTVYAWEGRRGRRGITWADFAERARWPEWVGAKAPGYLPSPRWSPVGGGAKFDAWGPIWVSFISSGKRGRGVLNLSREGRPERLLVCCANRNTWGRAPKKNDWVTSWVVRTSP